MGAKGGEDLARGLMFYRYGKERSEDDVGGGVAGLGLDLDRPISYRAKTHDRRIGSRQHRRIGIPKPPTFEGRVDDPPLTLPLRAIGHKDRLPEQKPQPFRHSLGLGKINTKAACFLPPWAIRRIFQLANGNGKSLHGLKILVIDDSKTIRRTAETLLTKEGCEVFTAVDGFDALSKIADHQPDIVFVDIMMPRLDGYQTCSLIKHNKVFRDTPVIMLSSKDGLFDRARGRIVGSEQYLTKPFTKDELLEAIEKHVRQ